jgi:CTP synthase (UTP-ammonia lyase)
MRTLQAGIIGDFNAEYPLHRATNESLQHAAAFLGAIVHSEWLPTDQSHNYSSFDLLLCSPGSPYRSFEGALEAIQFARESGAPFLGTCAGFQHAVLEFARNVMGLRDAAHAEYEPNSPVLFVTRLVCSLVGKTMPVSLAEGSKARSCYQKAIVDEAYYCNFGLNPLYRTEIEAAGLRITGRDPEQEPRIVELPSHPYFLGTLFVPQATSSAEKPHPLILGLCVAALTKQETLSTAKQSRGASHGS